MAVTFGWIGVLLSAPIAVTVIVLVQLFYVEDILGDSVTVLRDHGTAKTQERSNHASLN